MFLCLWTFTLTLLCHSLISLDAEQRLPDWLETLLRIPLHLSVPYNFFNFVFGNLNGSMCYTDCYSDAPLYNVNLVYFPIFS